MNAIGAAVEGLMDGFRKFIRGWQYGWAAPIMIVVFAFAWQGVADMVGTNGGDEAPSSLQNLRPLVEILLFFFVVAAILAPVYVGLFLGHEPSLTDSLPGGRSLAFAAASSLQFFAFFIAAIIGFSPFMLAISGCVAGDVREQVEDFEGVARFAGFDLEKILDAFPVYDIGIDPAIPLFIGLLVFIFLSVKLALLQPMAVEKGQILPLAASFKAARGRFFGILFGSILFAMGTMIILPIIVIPGAIIGIMLAGTDNPVMEILGGSVFLSAIGIGYFTMLAGFHRRLLEEGGSE